MTRRPRRLVLAYVYATLATACADGSAPAPEVATHETALCLVGGATPAAAPLVQRDGARLYARGFLGCADPVDPIPAAVSAVHRLRAPAVPPDALQLELLRDESDALGFRHLRFAQRAFGLEVAAGDVVVHLRDATGAIVGVGGVDVAPVERPEDVALDGRAALALALAEAGIAGEIEGEPELTYVATGDDGARLAWAADVSYQSAYGPERDRVFAGAIAGDLVARHPRHHRALNRRVYTANGGETLPGALLLQEGGQTNDAAAKAAYDNAGLVYKYYLDKFQRDSYDGQGAPLISTVHFGVAVNNAFWNGQQMVYGDGDGTTFLSFARSFDVVAHELTHAVTNLTADLVYQNESGALNEAMSDILGAAAEAHRDGGRVGPNTWVLGEDIFTPGTAGDGLRYMDNPTKDGISSDYYPERYRGTEDNGGVHLNSGIANLAFKLLVEGGTHPRAKTKYIVPALGIQKAEAIFYRALVTYMTPNTNFLGARQATAQAAADLYGPAEASAVQYAWDAVGAPGTPTRTPPALAIESPADGSTAQPGFTVTTRVAAGSEHDIAKVELYVNGTLAATAEKPPFAFSTDPSLPKGTVQLAVKWLDRSGQTRETTATVTLASPPPGGGSGGGGDDGPGGSGGSDPDGSGSEASAPVPGPPPGLCAVNPTGHDPGAPWLLGFAAALGVLVVSRRRP